MRPHRYVIALAILSACGASTAPPDATSGGDAAPRCEARTLESDLDTAIPLTGPGVDPATGLLVEPGPGGYVVSTTWGITRPEPAARARAGELFGAIFPALMANPGLVAFQLRASESCRSGRTLTVWRDVDSMLAFVGSAAHTAAMADVDTINEPGFTTTHWTVTSAADASWESAAARLATAD